jgi:hypothetical protein
MPSTIVAKQKGREVLRLRFGHALSQRVVGQNLRLTRIGAVNICLRRARAGRLKSTLRRCTQRVTAAAKPAGASTHHNRRSHAEFASVLPRGA